MGEYIVEICTFAPGEPGWKALAAYGEQCSWGAGKSMAAWMRSQEPLPWERAFAALDQGKICGYCTLAVYLISDHEGLYEKYGFVPVDAAPAPWNPAKTETIFRYDLPQG